MVGMPTRAGRRDAAPPDQTAKRLQPQGLANGEFVTRIIIKGRIRVVENRVGPPHSRWPDVARAKGPWYKRLPKARSMLPNWPTRMGDPERHGPNACHRKAAPPATGRGATTPNARRRSALPTYAAP